MNGSRKLTLVAGMAIIALTNVVALGGALWNRAGDPEAKLRLSERELSRIDAWYGSRENSGLALRPVWRVLVEEQARTQLYAWRYAAMGGAPDWLDRAKMQALGFDASPEAAPSGRSGTRWEKQLPREVLLVLELDGPAYRRALALVTEQVAREEAKPVAAGDKTADPRRKNAREALEWETAKSSRLFVIDAGLDADALRSKYPDRSRYAIVRGEVRPWTFEPRAGKAAGYVGGVSVASINVPLRLRKALADARLVDYDPRGKTPFEATVAWGRRLEPWMVEVARK